MKILKLYLSLPRVILIGSCLVANVMFTQRAIKISNFFFQTSFSFSNSECLWKRQFVSNTILTRKYNMAPHRLVALLSLLTASQSFLTPSLNARSSVSLEATDDRRSFLVNAAALSSSLLVSPALAAQQPEFRQDIAVTAFNGLASNYRGGEFDGLDASTLNEPSVPYVEFCEKLKAGEVTFVEFMAPDGDSAYATFKPKEGESKMDPIRIGQGYPIEQHDGYSSPLFVVKTVKKFGVPYKFTVPGLAKYSNGTN
jgi:hypothetical protein